MKMKKIVAMLLAAVMCLGLLAACGDKPSGNQPGENVIKLGMTGPLTGPYAIYGLAAARGAEIAVAEINAKGGVQFEFQYQDDEGDGEIAVNAYNKLMDWDMDVLVGTVTSGACIAVAAETYADRVFTQTPSASTADVTAGNENVIQV